MGFGLFTILQAVLAVSLIIELGLTAYCADLSSGYWPGSSPSSVSFMLFNTIWSILVFVYIAVIPIYSPSIYNSIIGVILEGVTTLFWFSGSLAMAVWVRGGAPAAAVAFGFLLLLIFLALFIYDLVSLIRSRGRGAHEGATDHVKAQTHPGI
ncbi:hypothetical protein B0T10DRAFT_609800 [Thelonectria olida]|uniref:MARVEL domain-containing protein n=1 Tax=Thelonectria olida TaxID=1576542 RepID=A0A9P8VYB3_9HYPO|nr:hypothetical protein B0T10DRAFT_609800 [Thelonectria olida]